MPGVNHYYLPLYARSIDLIKLEGSDGYRGHGNTTGDKNRNSNYQDSFPKIFHFYLDLFKWTRSWILAKKRTNIFYPASSVAKPRLFEAKLH
jgi:hypothetical protein